MMELVWVASVLKPYDLALHPNFSESPQSDREEVRLAADIAGGDWALAAQRYRDGHDIEEREEIQLARSCMFANEIVAAVPRLERRILHHRVDDPGELVALALIYAVSASELDDFDSVRRVLNFVLDNLQSGDPVADREFLALIVEVQLAFRQKVFGVPHRIDPELYLRIRSLSVDQLSQFEVGPGVNWNSTQTLRDIRDSLLEAAYGLLPFDLRRTSDTSGVPLWHQQVRAPATSLTNRAARGQASELSRYVQEMFDSHHALGRVVFGRRTADLFSPLLWLELNAHPTASRLRKTLAMMRWLKRSEHPELVGDIPRLLRQSGAKKELRSVVARLRSDGPLHALSEDVDRVLASRVPQATLSHFEIIVLSAGVSLIASSTLEQLLDGLVAEEVPRALAHGSRQGMNDFVEEALPLIGATARELGRSQVALQAFERWLGEGLIEGFSADRGLARALHLIDWDEVSVVALDSFEEALSQVADLNSAADSFSQESGRSIRDGGYDLSNLALRLDAALRGAEVSLDAADAEVVGRALRERDQEIRSGHMSFGSVEPSAVAVGVLRHRASDELWRQLAEFLCEPELPRSIKTRAFEMLAISELQLPPHIQRIFRDGRGGAFSSEPMEFDLEVFPYPAALRFYAVAQLMLEDDVSNDLATLAADLRPDVRREAAITLQSLARRSMSPGLSGLLLSLTRDDDGGVRAHAGAALVHAASQGSVDSGTASARIRLLLREDGILIPLTVLDALREGANALIGDCRSEILELRGHPSRRVREVAENLSPDA